MYIHDIMKTSNFNTVLYAEPDDINFHIAGKNHKSLQIILNNKLNGFVPTNYVSVVPKVSSCS